MTDKHKTKKQFRILKNNSGASLIFVLAVMFLLLAIGTSVLVAAGAGRGAMARQAEHNQVRLLDESVHQNIMHSLQNLNVDNSLGARIIWTWWNMYDEGNALENIELDISFTGGFSVTNEADGIWVKGITLEIPEPEASFLQTESRPPLFEEVNQYSGGQLVLDDNGLPVILGWTITDRIPSTVVVNLRLIVRVEIAVRDMATNEVRIVESEAEYVFIGDGSGITDADPLGHVCTMLSNPPHLPPPCLANCTGNFEELRLVGLGGQWTLERRGEMISRTDD